MNRLDTQLDACTDALNELRGDASSLRARVDTFEEGKHPRDEGGQFSSSSHGKSGQWESEPGLHSPFGNVSKRAKNAYLKRAGESLGKALEQSNVDYRLSIQPKPGENELRRAREFRDLAARGMKPRKFIKEAEKLEAEAARLMK